MKDQAQGGEDSSTAYPRLLVRITRDLLTRHPYSVPYLSSVEEKVLGSFTVEILVILLLTRELGLDGRKAPRVADEITYIDDIVWRNGLEVL